MGWDWGAALSALLSSRDACLVGAGFGLRAAHGVCSTVWSG